VFPFMLGVLLPGLARGNASADTTALALRRAWTLASLGIGVALLGAIGVLVAQTANAFGVPFTQAIGDRMVSVAFGTRFGLLWWTRAGLLLALSAIVLVARRGAPWPALLWIGNGLGVAVLLVHALGTHAAAVPDAAPAAVP